MFRWLNLAKRVSELEDMMIRLSKLMDDRDLDWEDMRARCKRLLDRTEKSARRVVESETQEDTAPEGTTSEPSHNGGRLLSPKQQLLQQQILRRRAGF